MGVEAAIPGDTIQALFHFIGKLNHLLRVRGAIRFVEHLRKVTAPGDQPGVISKENAEVCLLKIDDHDVAAHQSSFAIAQKVPCIDGETALEQAKLF